LGLEKLGKRTNEFDSRILVCSSTAEPFTDLIFPKENILLEEIFFFMDSWSGYSGSGKKKSYMNPEPGFQSGPGDSANAD